MPDRARAGFESLVFLVIVCAQAILYARLLDNAMNYDEGVYLAAVDAVRHGQELGNQVFAAQFPGFYDLLHVLAWVGGTSVTGVRTGLLVVFCLGTVGAWLVGRHLGGSVGAALTAALFVLAPPLDLFGSQVIADAPALALMVLAVGLATLAAPVAAVAAGLAFAFALSIKLTAITALPALGWYLRRRMFLALGGAIAVGLVLLLLHGGQIGSFWTSAVRYHELARSTPQVLSHPHREILDQIPPRTPFFWFAVAGVVGATIGLIRNRRLRSWPLWLWVLASVAFLLTHRPLHDNHLILFPGVLAVAVGATLGEVVPRHAAVVAVAAATLAAAYVQQWHRIDAANTPEPATNVAAAHALERLIPPPALTVDDRAAISFLAHRRVVGPVVDLAGLRFETGSVTDRDVIHELRRASAVVVSRTLRDRPRVLAAVRRSFVLRYDRGGVRIWVRR
jgi:hypothetical protein